MAVTWTLLSARAVGDGARVLLNWKLEGTTAELPGTLPDWQPGSGCTQTAPTTGDLYSFDWEDRILGSPSAPLFRGDLAEWKRVVTGSNVELTFSMRLALDAPADQLTRTEVAINAQAHTPIITIPANSVTLKFTGASNISGPPSEITASNLDCTGVGILPGGSNLKLFCDAHAQSVAQGLSAVTNLATWENLAASADLTSPTGHQPMLTTGTSAVPSIIFTAANGDHLSLTAADTPSLTNTATVAGVFIPDSSAATQHILGRWDSSGEAWRIRYDGSSEVRTLVYETKSGGSTAAMTYELDAGDTTVLFVFRRKLTETEAVVHEMWINGRLTTGTGSVPLNPNAGSGPLTVGARHNGSAWTDAFGGQINQVAVYDSYVSDMQLSLILHSMAHRAGVELGLPAATTQPYPASNASLGRPVLGRKPIAVIGLFIGESAMDENPYGQSDDWRRTNQATIERWLKAEIRAAINACDDFEIMFYRPGGSYADGVIPSDAFASAMNRGISGDEPMMTTVMIDAMQAVWIELNLGEASPEIGRGIPANRARRGWMYIGSGFAMEPDATLTPTGQMYNRNVAPATGQVYLDHLMSDWSAIDPDSTHRFRCFMLDLAASWRGLFIPMCSSSAMQDADFVFVGEAIAAGDDQARLGAAWFGALDFNRAPWWNKDDQGQYNREDKGYNTQWEGDWATKPVYFDVSNDTYPYLYVPDPLPPESALKGENMKLGDIYRFILKGGTPVARNPSVQKRVGAAWNYATGRLPQNTWDRLGRVVRFQR